MIPDQATLDELKLSPEVAMADGFLGYSHYMARNYPRLPCSNGCPYPSTARGLCGTCYLKLVASERKAAGDLCRFVGGCDRPRMASNGLCRTHNRQVASGGHVALKRIRKNGELVERPDGSRLCQTCLVYKSRTSFTKNRTQCHRCASTLTRYGLTPVQFAEMFQSQGSKCLICSATEPGGRWNSWHVDHDHDCCPTGVTCGNCVRGILCNNCNMGLGFFVHDARRLVLAAQYAARTRTGAR